uniref:DUF4276 family protein n=1 Tax=Acidicaldus sp. TaxID=1872105 RepID=A0A8J4HC51_9PROT
MSSVEIDYLGEGLSDLAIARKLIVAVGAKPGRDYSKRGRTGKDALDRRLKGLNAGCIYGSPVLVLRDLDGDTKCPGALVEKLLPNRNECCLLRIVVPSAEAWLMADRKAYADFCGVDVQKIPDQLEAHAGLKNLVLDWARSGTARYLADHYEKERARGVPEWAILGAWQKEFAAEKWKPARAQAHAPALARALSALRRALRR